MPGPVSEVPKGYSDAVAGGEDGDGTSEIRAKVAQLLIDRGVRSPHRLDQWLATR